MRWWEGKVLRVIFTDNAYIKEHRRSQIISIMTSSIYQEQRKLPAALRHAFFGIKYQ